MDNALDSFVASFSRQIELAARDRAEVLIAELNRVMDKFCDGDHVTLEDIERVRNGESIVYAHPTREEITNRTPYATFASEGNRIRHTNTAIEKEKWPGLDAAE